MNAHAAIAPCEECGARCSACDERMCALFGPEPEPRCELHPTCSSCADDVTCPECALILAERAQDRAVDVAYDVSREGA